MDQNTRPHFLQNLFAARAVLDLKAMEAIVQAKLVILNLHFQFVFDKVLGLFQFKSNQRKGSSKKTSYVPNI